MKNLERLHALESYKKAQASYYNLHNKVLQESKMVEDLNPLR